MNLILSASGWLCCCRTQSNRNIGKRLEKRKRYAPLGFVLALLLTLIISPVAAQSQEPTPVTIDLCVQEAVEKNLSLLAERYNLGVADARIITVRLRPNPVLNLYTDLQPWLGAGATELNQAGPPEYGIRADFIRERGQKRRYRIEVAEQEKAVAQLQLLNTVRALPLDAQNVFVEVLLAKETLALAERNLDSFHRIVEVSKERVRVGDLAQVELVRTRLAELQLNNAVFQAQSRLRIAKQRLRLLMGRAAPSESFNVGGEMRREPPPFTLEELWRQTLARRPGYRAMARDQACSVAGLLSQTVQGKVAYTIGAEYRRQRGLAGPGDWPGFFFSIPLPVLNRNQGETERARQERQQVEARARALEAGIRNELDAAWRQHDIALIIFNQSTVVAQTNPSVPLSTSDATSPVSSGQTTSDTPDRLTGMRHDSKTAGQNIATSVDPVSMVNHSSSSLFWISGQANIIYQAHPPFHALYSGANSLSNAGEYKTSLLGTLFLGLQVPHTRKHTEFLLDIESTGGRGLSQALGLAGFTNLDVVRNPNLSSKPYMARAELHQIIPLSGETTQAERGPLNMATEVPVRRLEVRLGKLSLPDSFDVNSVGSDSHLQFTNWAIDNNGAYDYAADTRGYTYGIIIEYQDRIWAARYGLMLMPTVANGINLDWNLRRARGENLEFELRKGIWWKRPGAIRILSYVNHAHMGSYREAVAGFLSGQDSAPDITKHEHFGAVKYGFGFNTQQQITDNLRAFARFGWNEGQHESFAYTEVDQTVLVGGDYSGRRWGREADKVGVAFVSNAIKKDHQLYLKYGGRGFLLGDGNLNYGRENILETYYNLHVWRGLFYSLGASFIVNPGYNRDRGPVIVPSVRMHIDL